MKMKRMHIKDWISALTVRFSNLIPHLLIWFTYWNVTGPSFVLVRYEPFPRMIFKVVGRWFGSGKVFVIYFRKWFRIKIYWHEFLKLVRLLDFLGFDFLVIRLQLLLRQREFLIWTENKKKSIQNLCSKTFCIRKLFPLIKHSRH